MSGNENHGKEKHIIRGKMFENGITLENSKYFKYMPVGFLAQKEIKVIIMSEEMQELCLPASKRFDCQEE